MLILPIQITQTAASGAWSFNTPVITGALLQSISCASATGNTTFDFTITDDKDNVVYAPSNSTGAHRANNVGLAVRGVLTIAVGSSSVDEAFTGTLGFKEAD